MVSWGWTMKGAVGVRNWACVPARGRATVAGHVRRTLLSADSILAGSPRGPRRETANRSRRGGAAEWASVLLRAGGEARPEGEEGGHSPGRVSPGCGHRHNRS